MTDPTSAFAKMVPGFEFLQGLVKNAGAAIPGMGQWIAPTLDPEELDKRISDLKTVQFWLEQNARLMATTIQALEVQRMTLATLKGMNVSMGDLTESLKIRMPQAAAPAPALSPAPAPTPAPAAASAPAFTSPFAAPAAAPFTTPPVAPPAPVAAEAPAASAQAPAAPVVPPGVADPMQWWGALTKQFTEIAASAMKDTASEAAKQVAAVVSPKAKAAASKPATQPAKRAAKAPARKKATTPRAAR